MKNGQPEEIRSDGSHGEPIAILDVDSNRASQRARNSPLAAAGFCVHGAPKLSQAVEAAMSCKPDIVLLSSEAPSFGLPDGAGAEICRRLKAGAPGNVPIVVLLVSEGKGEPNLRCCGADLCLSKSLAPAFLIETLRILLRTRNAERELERSRQVLLDFSRQLAHDIEGPLRGVVTFAELIGQAHPLSENERTYLRHVLSSADQARRVARCVLAYAEAGRQPPRMIALPLRGVVAATVHALRERIKESAADLHVLDPLPNVLGDFSALQQVTQNLVSNAINYRRPESSLSVTIGARRTSAGDWLVSIADNGIGVARQYQESIFAPFKRLHGLEIPGAGMGLAICKHIVEAHGGQIWVESEPGCGASFMFTLRAPA